MKYLEADLPGLARNYLNRQGDAAWSQRLAREARDELRAAMTQTGRAHIYGVAGETVIILRKDGILTTYWLVEMAMRG